MQFKEIEVKFNASNIPLSDFKAFCESRRPESGGVYAGYDHFYADTRGTDSFVRHRVGENFNQLTFKRKTADKNNFIRTENNITLGKDVSREEAAGLCLSFGYEYNTTIFKNIYVYNYREYVMSYYVVYDDNLHELGRYVEIEAREDYKWESEDEAWQEVVLLEAEAKVLGISPQARIKKSLFEQFRK